MDKQILQITILSFKIFLLSSLLGLLSNLINMSFPNIFYCFMPVIFIVVILILNKENR